jgi:hypothetical protein
MHYCPHCHKPTALSTGPCPHCGKNLGGDETAPSAPSAPAPAAAGSHGGANIDLDTSGESLDLDFDPRKERLERKPSRSSVGPAIAAGAGKKVSRVEQKPGVREGRLQIDVDGELNAISGYGPPPDGWGGAISYMFKVRGRRKMLLQEIMRIEQDYSGKRKDLGEDLLVIGRRKMAEPNAEQAYARQMEAIKMAREKVDETKQEKSVESRDMEDKEAYLDDEIMRLQNEVDRYRVEEEAVAREAQQRGGEYKKARLKMQRFDIEIRNIRQLSLGQGKGAEPADPARVAPLNAQLAGLERQKQAFDPELKSLQAAAEETDRKLAMVRSSIAEVQGKITIANKRKSQVASTFRKRAGEMEQAFLKIQEEHDRAVRDLAVASLEKNDLPAEFADLKEKLSAKIKSVDAVESHLQKVKTAMDSYSRVSFQRAYIVMGVGAGLVVLLILLIALIL